MRWIWIDRFVEFESGRRARAIKNVSMAEEHLHDHFPGYPIMPNCLIVEGLAQTGGLLVGEYNNFRERVVLAKVPKSVFHFPAFPGDQLTYTTVVEYIKRDGAMVTATSHVGDRLQAEMEIVYAHVDDPKNQVAVDASSFVFTMKMLGVFEVGRNADGTRLTEPNGLAKWRAAHITGSTLVE
jgi:3-hydroxyacyl-[acyl-carrier-protein] dehydratase